MIRADFEPAGNGVLVYRWDNLPGGIRSYWTHDGKRKEVKQGDPAPWWLVLDHADAKALVTSMQDYLEEEQRGDPEDYGYIKGLYEAQRDHLQFAERIINKMILMEDAPKEPEPFT